MTSRVASPRDRVTARGQPDDRLRVRAIYTRYRHCGAHSGIKQLLSSLDPRRLRVDRYAVTDGDDDLHVPFETVRGYLRTRVRRRGMEWYKLSDLAAELRALPGCLTRRTDVVHFLDGEHSAQYLPYWLRRSSLAHTRVVATFHQMPDMLERLVSPDVVAAIDHVTVMSPAQVPYFTAILPPERIHVLLHGIDTAFFTPAERPPETGVFRAITVGHWLRDWKAVRAAAERLGSEKHVEFHVVTDRPTGLDDLPNVVTHRNVDDGALVSLYQSANCLLLPLLDSTANNSLLEGIACGLPVISTSLPSVRAYVPGKEAILVDDNDADRLVDALLHLQRHVDLRAEMGACARARAEQLSWSRVAPRYERLYFGRADGVTADG